MSYFDIETYNYNNLKPEDKVIIKLIIDIQGILDEDNISDFLDEKDITGEHLRGVVSDLLAMYADYIDDLIEMMKRELIVSIIDGYSDEDFQAIVDAQKK